MNWWIVKFLWLLMVVICRMCLIVFSNCVYWIIVIRLFIMGILVIILIWRSCLNCNVNIWKMFLLLCMMYRKYYVIIIVWVYSLWVFFIWIGFGCGFSIGVGLIVYSNWIWLIFCVICCWWVCLIIFVF